MSAPAITYQWQFRKKNPNRQILWFDEAVIYSSEEEAIDKQAELLSRCDMSRCLGHRIVMKIDYGTPNRPPTTVPVFYLLNSKPRIKS